MKALLLSLTVVALFGCTKHRLEKFNNRIVGSWDLVEVNTFGVGSSNIVFNGGSFSFRDGNSLDYYDRNNVHYSGTWYIDAYTYDNGEDTDTEFILSMDVSNGRDIKHDQMEIPRFGDASRFKAKVRNGLNTVTYIFERR